MEPIDIPPGVRHTKAKASKSTNWYEVNLVRWEEGTLFPVGGWERLTYTVPFASRCRATHKWVDNSGVLWTAYLCEQHVYVESGGILTDISPVVPISPPYSGSYATGGYGDDPYGTGTYGTPRDTRPRFRPYTPSYSIGNWGEELRIMTSADGRYLGWDPSGGVGVKAAAIAGAPINNRCFVITPERHVILFGVAGNFANIGWCSREDDTDWNFASVLNTAGELPVEPKSPIVTAKLLDSNVLFFTADGRAFILEYIGTPYIYSLDSKGECSVPYSADAVGVLAEGAAWMTQSGFWSYDGVTVRPFPCEVWDWIKDRVDDYFTRYEAVAVPLKSKSEIWYFFVGQGSQYNNFYVSLDYGEGYIWSMGTLGRSAGFSFPNDDFPIMVDGTVAYRHETGFTYTDYSAFPFAETFTINAGSGTFKTTLMKLLPEVDGDNSVLRFSVAKRNKRVDGAETYSSQKKIRDNGYVDMRETARDLRLRIEAVAVPNQMWSLGQTLVDLKARGKR